MKRVLIAALLIALTGCTNLIGGISGVRDEHTNNVISSSYRAINEIVSNQAQGGFGSGRRILVATIVNLNNLNESSPFGRLVAEHAASRLVQLGAKVSELKLRGNLFVSEKQGELLLSREIKEISNNYNADAVLVGTYVEATDRVYVTLKLVRAQDAQILGAYNYSIDKNGSLIGLLRNS